MNNINQQLINCVITKDLNGVLSSLEAGANVHYDNDCAIRVSAATSNWNMVLKLLEYGANMHAHFDCALRWSAQGGHVDVVTKLLEMGANVNAHGTASGNMSARSALEFSIDRNHFDVVIKLLEYGADVHIDDDIALQLSVQNKHYAAIEKLLEHGANIYCNNKQILGHLQTNFDEAMADIMLPYCNIDDYKYFPDAYIRKRIIPTKNANASANASAT